MDLQVKLQIRTITANAMTAAESRVIRESLALTRDWLAALLHVAPRTVQNREHDKYAIPDGVRAQIEALEIATTQAVDLAIEYFEDICKPNDSPLLSATGRRRHCNKSHTHE